MKNAVFIMVFMGVLTHGKCQTTIAKIFTSNMVLQRGMEVPVWGWGTPGIKVSVSFDNQKVTTQCARDGRWSVKLASMQAGGPFDMKVSGGNEISLKNILVGDVWLCTGQSNMWRPVSSVTNAEEEIAKADYPEIRLFSVPRTFRKKPVDDIPEPFHDEKNMTTMQWEACTPKTISEFTAVGYFFGRDIYLDQKVPVGLVKVCWGSTKVEPWLSAQALATVDGYQNIAQELVNPVQILDSVTSAYKSRVLDLDDAGFRQDEAMWAKAGLDTDHWKTMAVPQPWEQAGLPNVDGIVWFRRTFLVPGALAGQPATLSLGEVSDANQVWVNGQLVGENEGQIPGSPYYQSASWSKYALNPGVLQAGENVIAVRAINFIGNGGMVGSADNLFLSSGNFKLSLAGEWWYKLGAEAVAKPPMRVRPHQNPTVLFNGMINPLIPFAIKGTIWYQGESNTGHPENYHELFTTMIKDWRQRWGEGDFPFLFVQLANFGPPAQEPVQDNWALLREAQTQTLSLPNTGMAVTIDIGDANTIHPTNKQDVGHRLAQVARQKVYGEDIVSSGPAYQSIEVKNGKVYLSFAHTDKGLVVKNRYGYVEGFAVAGKDRKFYWARGYLEGDKVVVFSPDVKAPVAVRYAWSQNPGAVDLYNAEGLPAVPFRTDKWK